MSIQIFFKIVFWILTAFLSVALCVFSGIAGLFLVAWWKGWLKKYPNMTPNQILDKLFSPTP